MMKQFRLYRVIASLIALFATFFCVYSIYSLYAPVVSDKKGVIYYLQPGTSAKSTITQLTSQNLIRSPRIFSIYLAATYSLGHAAKLKTGEYLFPEHSTPISIWKQLTQGTGHYYRRFTIIPGWTFIQLRTALSKTNELQQSSANWDEQKLMTYLGSPNLKAEGEFFPETYYYTRGVFDLVILKRAFNLMQQKFNDAWLHRAENLPYQNQYEALIAASLIEKEAYLASERPIIAGVLINRLRKHMLLQFDPTVIYGLGARYTGKIYKENLLEDTLYNTYVHKGLPPTPIAIPSMASISAVLHPEQHDYLYFVARGDGSHQFSTSLAEHNVAVNAVAKKE
jgi:UPF0755 protein